MVKEKSTPKKKSKSSPAYLYVLIIVVIAAAVTIFSQQLEANKDTIPTVPVPVANQLIIANTVITEDMIDMDARYVPDVLKYNTNNEICATKEMVVGKRASMPIYPGEMINKNRIVENTRAMTEYSAALREVSIEIESVDLGLSFKSGDFVDVWKVPTNSGVEQGLIPEKIVSTVQLAAIHTSDGMDITNYVPAEGDSESFLAPGYFTLHVSGEQQAEIFNINDKLYTIRVSKHTPNNIYEDISELMREANEGASAEKQNK